MAYEASSSTKEGVDMTQKYWGVSGKIFLRWETLPRLLLMDSVKKFATVDRITGFEFLKFFIFYLGIHF